MTGTTKEGLDPQLIELYRSRSIQDIIDNPIPKALPILDRGVLFKESKACIYGSAKAAKSCFSIQQGLCIASGKPFLDIDVIQQQNVLYLNFELHPSIFEERIIDIKDKLGIRKIPQRFHHLTLLGEDIPLLDTSNGLIEVGNILQVQDEMGFKVDVLMWDCRYKTFSKSENEDDVLKVWVRNMDELIKNWKFTPIIVHHQGKKTIGVGAGSSVFDRWVNTATQISPHNWASALQASKERKIIISGNYTAGYEVHTVLDYPVHCVGGDEIWEKPKTKQQETMDLIIEILQSTPGNQLEQSELWAQVEENGITLSTFNNAKRKLTNSNLVKSEQNPNKSGHHNVITLTLPLPE
ncbi:AAA family ATPase [Chloroflexota bacterium]